MIKILGILFGMAFLLGGTLGFVPGVTQDGMYFGVFMVNTAHNVLHIVSGTIFVMASMAGARLARLWFQIFGALYAAIAVMGFGVGDGLILGLGACGVGPGNAADRLRRSETNRRSPTVRCSIAR
jgi:Domain of unknown function (DUF4383)